MGTSRLTHDILNQSRGENLTMWERGKMPHQSIMAGLSVAGV